MASCSASGPGSTWQKLSARTNSSSPTQRRRSTQSRCIRPICATGPPNASHPSLAKYAQSSRSEGAASLMRSVPSEQVLEPLLRLLREALLRLLRLLARAGLRLLLRLLLALVDRVRDLLSLLAEQPPGGLGRRQLHQRAD